MTVNSEQAKGFAELFHHYYSALAPDFGCAGVQTPEWETLPANERQLFVAASRLALEEAQSCVQSQVQQSSAPRSGTEGRECGC